MKSLDVINILSVENVILLFIFDVVLDFSNIAIEASVEIPPEIKKLFKT